MGTEWSRVEIIKLLVVGMTIVTVFSTMVAVLSTGAMASGAWSSNVKVNQGPSPFLQQREPSMTVDSQSRLGLGWIELNLPGTNESVAFSRSLDGGVTWAPRTFMAYARPLPNRDQSDPWLALDGLGRLYYSRLEFSSGKSSDPQSVVVSRSDDGGANWGSPVNATMTMGRLLEKDSLTGDGSRTVYAAFTDENTFSLPGPIRVTHSSDGALTWSSPATVSDASSDFVFGAILLARPGGEVHAFWIDFSTGNIMSDRSTDFGQTWGRDIRVNDVPGAARDWPWVIMNSKGTIVTAWPDGRNGDTDIYASRSNDGGATWSTAVRVNDDASGRDQTQVALAVDGTDVIHAAWADFRTGNYNIFYSNSKDGRRWSANERVTDTETIAANLPRGVLGDYIALRADSLGNVYASWTDGRNGDADIYFAKRAAPNPGPLQVTSELGTGTRPEEFGSFTG